MSNTFTRLYVHFVFAIKCRQLLIRDLLVNESIEVETPETGYLAGLTLSENLQNMFDRADFIIFLIPPDNFETNSNLKRPANIMFELGMALGLGKPLLPLVEKGTKFPSELSGIMLLQYERDNLDEIFHYIKNWIYRFAEPAEKYVSK